MENTHLKRAVADLTLDNQILGIGLAAVADVAVGRLEKTGSARAIFEMADGTARQLLD